MIAWLMIAVATAKLEFGQVGRTASPEHYWAEWKHFMQEHSRDYATQDEHDRRFNIFMNNIDKINRHNALDLSWKMGVTPFADLTSEEFKNKTSCMKGLKNFHGDNIKVLDESANADSIDWVAEGKVTPVKNQGQCGSCWAFSTTGSVEARSAIAAHNSPQPLSEQELVSCSFTDGNDGCNGGLMDYGFKYVKENGGLCSETDYPYSATNDRFGCKSSRSACSQKYDAISNYADVTSNSMSQLEAAVTQGPVSIAIEADQSSFQLYKEGVFQGRCGKKLDHGVLVVGYGTSADGDFWKVKNSWGPTWGENGYIRLCKGCGANGSAGQCGILLQPSYPVV